MSADLVDMEIFYPLCTFRRNKLAYIHQTRLFLIRKSNWYSLDKTDTSSVILRSILTENTFIHRAFKLYPYLQWPYKGLILYGLCYKHLQNTQCIQNHLELED